MTLFGKILVFAVTTAALVLCGWAVGVYTRHIEWSADTGKSAQETVADVTRLQEELKGAGNKPGTGLLPALASAEDFWANPGRSTRGTSLDAYSRVQYLEAQRPENQKWYAEQLNDLASGTREVKRPSYKDGLLEFDPTPGVVGRPKLVEAADRQNQPLKSLAAYRQQYNTQHLDILQAMQELDKWINRDAELTKQIGGEGGLREQIGKENDKRQRVLTEQDFLKPLLVNSAVEGELLAQRRAALEARVKELKAVGVATSRP